MTVPTFAARRKAWSSPPVDDIGYLPAKDMLAMSDEAFSELMLQFWNNRYGGWRNWKGKWVETFGLWEGGIRDKRVLDYGCGVGMEGAQYASLRNTVWLADVSADNIAVAKRLFGLYGKQPEGTLLIKGEKAPLSWVPPDPFDVIHCCGVLHHIPDPVPLVQAMAGWLTAGGRLNLMVYSDMAWRIAVGTDPPPDVTADPRFDDFWTRWDPIGGYADWYNRARLEERFGEWFTVETCLPLTQFGEYLGAVLVKK